MHEENAKERPGDWKVSQIEQDNLSDQQGCVNTDGDEKQFCEEKFGPFVGTSKPVLTVADERIALNDANDEEYPYKHKQCGKQFEEVSRKANFQRAADPLARLVPNIDADQRHGDQNFRPVAAEIFHKDVEDDFHRRDSIKGVRADFAMARKMLRMVMELKVACWIAPKRWRISDCNTSCWKAESINFRVAPVAETWSQFEGKSEGIVAGEPSMTSTSRKRARMEGTSSERRRRP